jgi:peptidoglycan/xylan/chitin deacetylase (PgdA/CDA1 family)
MSIKRVLLHACKWIGLFAIARRMTRGYLRVLCYHGFALEDEHLFRPNLFMTPDLFEKRLKYLQRQRHRVLDLHDAVERLGRGALPPDSVVITIDDGFFGVYKTALPLLQKYGFPATLYVTTYYVKHPNPIFRIAAQYIFWKTSRQSLDLSQLSPALPSRAEIAEAAGERALWRLIEYGENQPDESDRYRLLVSLAEILDVDFTRIVESRICSLVRGEEIRSLEEGKVSVQLHTHRHRMPDTPAEITDEIERNREVLQPWTGSELVHFCYPSGVWSREHWPVLAQLGVKTATTCVPGLNRPGDSPLALRRFLDRQDCADIEFEAEVSGFKDLVRMLAGSIRATREGARS